MRGNGGGNMWPMVAGVGAVLGEGVAGYFIVPVRRARIEWSFRAGAALSGTTEIVRTSAPIPALLARARPCVAVLTDQVLWQARAKRSSCRSRARPETRSFRRVSPAGCPPPTAASG